MEQQPAWYDGLCIYIHKPCVYAFGGMKLGVQVTIVMVHCTYIDAHKFSVYVCMCDGESVFLVCAMVYVSS